MKPKPPVAAELSWAQVHAYRISRHHLAKRAAKKDLVRVVGDIGGAQAQLMPAAELQVGVRVDCRVEDVRSALWKERSLVKTWLMRGTLHLVPADDLPLYSAAMRTRWVRINKSWLKFVGMPEPELLDLFEAIGDAVNGNPMTREHLISAVSKGRPQRVETVMRSGWGTILKPVARRGLLCFGPSVGQSVTFVRPQQWLASWREVEPDAALAEVGRRYLHAFGPATKEDFANWWGRWPGVAKAAWTALVAELVEVSIEGRRAQLLAADLHQVARMPADSSVQLLPAFDPYLMGHDSRDHLFDSAYRWRVSRVAGWISPVVLVDGRVVATWTHQVVRRALQVTIEPFRKLSPGAIPKLRERAAAVATTLGLAGAAVKIA